MNDFLKSLRVNKEKQQQQQRYDRTNRRPYGNNTFNGNPPQGNPQYRGGNERPGGNVKKPPHHVKPQGMGGDRLVEIIDELLPQIRQILDRFGGDLADRQLRAEERKAEALESIAGSLVAMMESSGPRIKESAVHQPVEEVAGGAMPATADQPERALKRLPRRDVLDIIFTMRDDGATYGQIADRLENESIPTFSGKGKWHAQTIHRVCQVGRSD